MIIKVDKCYCVAYRLSFYLRYLEVTVGHKGLRWIKCKPFFLKQSNLLSVTNDGLITRLLLTLFSLISFLPILSLFNGRTVSDVSVAAAVVVDVVDAAAAVFCMWSADGSGASVSSIDGAFVKTV